MSTDTTHEPADTPTPTRSLPARGAMTAYGVLVYLAFLMVFLYSVGFVENLVVPKGIDDGSSTSTVTAVVVDVALLGLFAVQHSVMARPAFKRWWTRFVPQPIERTTYVLAATALLAVVMWQWQPLPTALWEVDPTWARVIVHAVSFGGWGLVLLSTFLIDHFDLFGVKQVVRHHAGRDQTSPAFQAPLVYGVVRHPLYLGFVIAFWAAPTMTAGRLLFATVMTAWVLIAIQLEERDLVAVHGDQYADYRDRTPMLLPTGRPRQPPTSGRAPPPARGEARAD